MKNIRNVSVQGKTVLLRSDLNSDVVKGKVVLGPRIKEAATTIKHLKNKKAKVVILAHQGNKRKKDFTSLKQHGRLLNKITKVRFVADVCGKKAQEAIKNLKSGEAILLENVRYEKSEVENPRKNNKILKNLGPLGDLYVNDAFSVSHRNHTTLTRFKEKMPAYAGPLVEKEMKALQRIKLGKALFILGGGKPEANTKLLGKKGVKIIAVGYFGQLILISNGTNLGYQNNYLKKEALIKKPWRTFVTTLKKKAKGVMTPVDFALNVRRKRVEKNLSDFPQPYQIDDIGTETIKKIKEEIGKAHTIYMKGPTGYSSNKTFAKGTIETLKAIATSNAYSIVGGGHLNAAISEYKINKKKFNHVSLSGGALANHLAGKKLPGIEALKKKT